MILNESFTRLPSKSHGTFTSLCLLIKDHNIVQQFALSNKRFELVDGSIKPFRQRNLVAENRSPFDCFPCTKDSLARPIRNCIELSIEHYSYSSMYLALE